jgi:flagellar hook assembly protein FlgD
VKNSKSIFEKGESMFARVNTELATAITEPNEPVSVKCYPNPFTDRITIEIVNSEARKLDVKIFGISGQIIRTLYSGNSSEKTVLVWDGKNDQGVKTAPGSYLLKANNTVEKIVLSH